MTLKNTAQSSRNAKINQLATVDEPICILNIEIDGKNSEEIKLFENDDPEQIV